MGRAGNRRFGGVLRFLDELYFSRSVGGSSPASTPARLGGAPIVDDRFGERLVGLWEGYAEDEIAERWPEQ